MATNTFILPFRPAFDSNGLPVAGARLNFYLTGTTTRSPVFADALMLTELPNPVIANSAGRFPEIYINSAITYRVVVTDTNSVVLDDADPYTYANYGTVDILNPQTIGGAKTFTNLATFSAGLAINGQTLDGLTAFGVSLGETATAVTARTLLGLGTMALESTSTYAPLTSPTFTGITTYLDFEIGFRNIPIVSKTAAFTFASTDRGKGIYYTGAGTATATISDFSVVPIPVGATLAGHNNGGGALTLTGEGVTLKLNGATANSNVLVAIGGRYDLTQWAQNVWTVSGTGLTSISPFPTYALADRFTIPEYWVAGTQYSQISTLPGYSFTRSGIQGAVDSTGAVQFFPANIPAINDRGYHVYGALTNGILNSQDSSGYDNRLITFTANTAVAPDGATTMDKIVATAATGVHGSNAGLAGAAAGAYTVSRFIRKSGAHRYVWFGNRGSGETNAATFDLVLGTVVGSHGCTGYIVDRGLYWQVVVTLTTTLVQVSNGIAFATSTHSGGDWPSTTTTGTETLESWQAQAIAGNFPDGGPIIATGATTASIGESIRKQNAKADGTALVDQDMLIFATGTPQGPLASQTFFELNETVSGVANRVILSVNATGGFTALVTAASVAVYSATPSAATRGQKATIVIRRLSGAWRAGKVIAGVLTWFDVGATAAFPTLLTTLADGNSTGGGAPFQGAETGGFIKNGTFDTDAKVLAAVAETA